MGFSSYTGTLATTCTDSPKNAGASSSLPLAAPSASQSIQFKINYQVGTTGSNKINEVSSGILTIAEGSSATLNLQSLTDMFGTAGIVLVRLKKYFFKLLSAIDDSLAGTACSSVTIGNAGSDPHLLNMGGTTPTQTLLGSATTNGDQISYASADADGLAVSATVKNVLVTNNDSGHAAAVFYDLGGSDA